MVQVDDGRCVLPGTRTARADIDTSLDGKALADEIEALDKLAAELGVPPLLSFVSADADEFPEFVDEAVPGLEAEWFDAAAGLVVVRALLGALEKDPDVLDDDEGVIRELQAMQQMLEAAERQWVRFRLMVDI